LIIEGRAKEIAEEVDLAPDFREHMLSLNNIGEKKMTTQKSV
jgi:hypothetical protein